MGIKLSFQLVRRIAAVHYMMCVTRLPFTGVHVWEGSLIENMDGIKLASHESSDAEPLLRDLKLEVNAAWEEHAAKRSRKVSPNKAVGDDIQQGQPCWTRKLMSLHCKSPCPPFSHLLPLVSQSVHQ